MKFLYKLSLLNENEIRNGLQPRCVYVAASSMADAVSSYDDSSSLVQSVEFVSPITVVSSCLSISLPVCHIRYLDRDDSWRSALIHASDVDTAHYLLVDFLGYTPVDEQIMIVDDIVS